MIPRGREARKRHAVGWARLARVWKPPGYLHHIRASERIWQTVDNVVELY